MWFFVNLAKGCILLSVIWTEFRSRHMEFPLFKCACQACKDARVVAGVFAVYLTFLLGVFVLVVEGYVHAK